MCEGRGRHSPLLEEFNHRRLLHELDLLQVELVSGAGWARHQEEEQEQEQQQQRQQQQRQQEQQQKQQKQQEGAVGWKELQEPTCTSRRRPSSAGLSSSLSSAVAASSSSEPSSPADSSAEAIENIVSSTSASSVLLWRLLPRWASLRMKYETACPPAGSACWLLELAAEAGGITRGQ